MRPGLKGLAAGAFGLLALVTGGAAVYQISGIFEHAGQQSFGLLRPADLKTVALGEAIYTANCAVCHGENLEGAPGWQSPNPDGLLPAPPHDETGHTWHHPDQLLFDMTKFGIGPAIGDTSYRSAMPAYEDILSDQEIIAVLSFIKSTWPDSIRQSHDRLNTKRARITR